jgi:nucleoid-associated protein YgaU
MWVASDIAEWWDEQHRSSSKALDAFVDEHPNWIGIIVAGTTATAMDLGAGLVDVLRLGEGAAAGGVKGFAQDGLRLLQLAPAVGKLSRFTLARIMADPGGGICTWVSAAKALRQVGVKAFASVDDLAQAGGLGSIKQLGGAFVDRLVPILRALGARVELVGELSSLESVNAAVKGQGVVLFSVKWVRATGKTVGHTLYAFRDLRGRVVYADRSGVVVTTLAALERFYQGIGSAKVYGPAALVQGARILIADGLAVLGIEVRAQLTVNPETAAQVLEVKKAVSGNVVHLVAPRTHNVAAGDWLSKLAQKYYGDMYKWPVIYEANRALIGGNPDLIKPGQRLLIPDLPKVNAKRR